MAEERGTRLIDVAPLAAADELIGVGKIGGLRRLMRITIGQLSALLLGSGPLADRLGPPVARPGTSIVQKSVALLKRSTGLASGEFFTGALRSPQGAACVRWGGVYYIVLKQRTSTGTTTDPVTGLPVSTQRFRYVLYPYSDIGLAEVAPIGWTIELDGGHQGIGAFEDAAGLRWVWTSSGSEVIGSGDGDDQDDDDETPPDVGEDGPGDGEAGEDEDENEAQTSKRYGLQRIRWKGVSQDVGGGTAQSDCTNYKMFPGFGGSGRLRNFYGDSGLCSDDGKFVIMVAQNIQNRYRSDGVRYVFGWLRTEVEAAPGGDCTNLRTAFEFVIPPNEDWDSDAMQDFSCDGRFFYAFSGQTMPRGRHKCIVIDVATGAHLRTLESDDVRANFTNEELSFHPTLGMPASMETEGGFTYPPGGGGWPHFVTQEVWVTPTGDVVSDLGRNWFCIHDGNKAKPGALDNWTVTSLPATRGQWDPYATYRGYLQNGGSITRTRAVVTRYKEATGEFGEKPIDAGLTTAKSTSALTLNRSDIDICIRYGSAFKIGHRIDQADEYQTMLSLYSGQIAVRDTDPRGVLDRAAYMQMYSRVTTNGLRRQLRLAIQDGITGMRIYAPDDVLYPGYFSIYADSPGRTGAIISYTPAGGFQLKSAAGALISIDALKRASDLNSAVRVVTAAGAAAVSSTDSLLVINKTTAASSSVTLPSDPAVGRVVEVKDGKGDAAANPITINAASGHLIDGSSSYVISANKACIRLKFVGTGAWSIIGSYPGA